MKKGIWGILLAIAFTATMLTSVYATQGENNGKPFQQLESLIISSQGVPVGTVLDWWCSTDCTIPEGYAIADGSTVTDPDSPLFGETLPDLSDRFVKGVTSTSGIGTTGGSSTHSHAGITNLDTHKHGATTSIDEHSHQLDVSVDPHSHEVRNLDEHSHEFTVPTDGLHDHDVIHEHGHGGVTHPTEDVVRVQPGDGPLVATAFHVHGISPDLDELVTSKDGDHDHESPSRTETTGGPELSETFTTRLNVDSTMDKDSHLHDVDVTNDSHLHSTSTDEQDNDPEFYTLLKIIRIK